MRHKFHNLETFFPRTSSKEVLNPSDELNVKLVLQWNLSNTSHQGTGEMCQIVQDV